MTSFKSSLTGATRALLLMTAAAVPAAMLTTSVEAQQVTSAVRGTIVGPDGNAVADAEITVIDTRTGRASRATTNANGQFNVTGLEVGGPYNVLIESGRYQTERVEGLNISLSQAASLNVTLSPAREIEEIVVTAAASVTSQLAIGPSVSFGLDTLTGVPSIQRDIRDTIRIDPRVTIDDTNDDSIQCLGGNNRFNSFTIDGVRNADAFGLNASGFPARNTQPIPFDAIREVSVEFAPFDVEFGQFTGCNINVVTKSGSNEIHGSSFFVFNSDGLTGSTLEGDEVLTEDFRDWNWGAEISGPIVEDKLFLYFAYEEVKDTNTQNSGPIGGGFANEDFITVDQANQISDVLQNTFNRDPLGIVRNLPSDSRRFLGRLDWFINEDHRAAFTYTRMREEVGSSDDFGFNGFAFRDNFQIQGSEVETYSLRVFSDWTDNLSTEIRVSRIDNQDLQDPIGGGEAQSDNPKPRLIVQDGNGDDIAISGPGFFRAANFLDTQIDQIKIKADYTLGRHTLTAGYELDQLDVFNLFAPNSTGTIEFADLAAFQAGQASNIEFNGSFSGDINDAAADFSRSIHSIYVQDEWQATPDLQMQFGMRYDFYASNDNPRANSQFEERFGFDNTQAFDGLDIVLPRFGFTYDAPWKFHGRTVLRGGAGIFTGGDPSVWFSNAFTNFGSSLGSSELNSQDVPAGCSAADLQVIDGSGNFTGIPDCLRQAASGEALENNGAVDAVDPEFTLPSVVRGSFGLTHYTDFNGAAGGFFDDWEINMDIIHTRRRNAPDFVDLTLTPVGRAPDGRPIFARVDPLEEGCNAVFLGPRDGFSNVTDACLVRDDQDILLTNVDGDDNGGSLTLSTQFYKQFGYEIFDRPGTFDLNVGYAFTDAKDVNPSTSSTSGSNTEEVALSVVNRAPLAPSQFVNRHNVTMAATFRTDFWEDNTTTLSFIFRATEGQPFSFTFGDDTTEDLFGDTDNEARQLLYVPTGRNDPLVDFSNLSESQISGFFNFIDEVGLSKFAGEIAPRNAFRDPWFKDLDIRFAQELPGFFGQDKFEVTFDFDNFLNFIDSGANIQKRFDRGDIGEGVPLVSAELSEDGSQFVFQDVGTGLASDNIEFVGGGGGLDRVVDASVWRIQIGVRYSF